MTMTLPQKLHAFARQVCMDRFRLWSSIYAPIASEGRDRVGMGYIKEAYRVFPRYNVAEAVLQQVERLNADDLPEFEQLQQLLVDAARRGTTDFTKRLLFARTHNAAMADEREWLSTRFGELTPGNVAQQTALPYRRVLSADEIDALRLRMTHRCGARDPWFPLTEKTHLSLIAYDLDTIDEPALEERIKQFFSNERVTRLFQIHEGRPSYEVDASMEDLLNDIAEGFWIDPHDDWIAYWSFEDTITFGGKLADSLRDVPGCAPISYP